MHTFAEDPLAEKTDPMGILSNMASTMGVLALANEVLLDPNFRLWTAAAKANTHHYGKGGLLVHTWEVATFCWHTLNVERSMYADRTEVWQKDLFLAALYHDVGKIYDYAPVEGTDFREWKADDHKYKIHHISRSAFIWMDMAQKHKYAGDVMGITHAILAHHGHKEYGSPVEPRTRMAHILHCSDMLSARLEDCDTLFIK